MAILTLKNTARWCGGTVADNFEDIEFTGVSTDSRTIEKGNLFIPLSGENFDGHAYIKQALKRGAAAFAASSPFEENPENIPVIRVENTLTAYQDIASGYLSTFNIPVIAITGSNGKTTTKDMVTQILSGKFNVLATEKNFNNEVGVPQTIMQLNSGHQVLVVEMAMRGPGQIAELARIVTPDAAVITNIGESHFELLGSFKAIAEAKGEILGHMNPKGFAVLNADDPWYQFLADLSPATIATFGINRPADTRLIMNQDRGLNGFTLQVAMEGRLHSFNLPLLGLHNIYNALSAITVARCMRMSPKEIAEGMQNLKPSEKRMEVLRADGGWVVLNDTYNASPTSTAMALEILGNLPKTGRKIAVLADMLELGKIEEEAHLKLGGKSKSHMVDILFTTGELGRLIGKGALDAGMAGENVVHSDDRKELMDRIQSTVKKGDIILVKGSRRMKMEEITEKLTEETAKAR